MKDRYKKIERLGDRVTWMIGSLPKNGDYKTRVDSKAALFKALHEIEDISAPAPATFNRYMLDEVTGIPLKFALSLIRIFPTMKFEHLTCETWAEFERHTELMKSNIDRWLTATGIVASRRGELARLAKRYYLGVDEFEADFPLVGRSQWLLANPIRLSEHDAVRPFDIGTPDMTGPLIADGVGTYRFIKERSLKPGRKLTNGLTYRLSAIDTRDDSLQFTYSEGYYFNYIDTCELLAAELADRWQTGGKDTLDFLPMRGAPDRIFDLRTRSAFPGVNCLLFLKNYFERSHDKAQDKFVLHDRGKDTAEAQNTVHVVPAGGHQPGARSYESEIEQSIWYTAVREFTEELFSKEEAQKIRASSAGFLDHPDIRPYVQHFFRTDGVAAIYLLGVGFDPVTTKPEILVAIVVDWRKAWKGMQKEFRELKIINNYEGEIDWLDLSRKRLLDEVARQRGGKTLLPAAAACLIRAADFYETIYNMR